MRDKPSYTVRTGRFCSYQLSTTYAYTGGGASPEGNRPFLDLLDVHTKETKRLWQSTPPFLEYPMNMLNDLDDRPIRYESLPCIALRHLKLSLLMSRSWGILAAMSKALCNGRSNF